MNKYKTTLLIAAIGALGGCGVLELVDTPVVVMSPIEVESDILESYHLNRFQVVVLKTGERILVVNPTGPNFSVVLLPSLPPSKVEK